MRMKGIRALGALFLGLVVLLRTSAATGEIVVTVDEDADAVEIFSGGSATVQVDNTNGDNDEPVTLVPVATVADGSIELSVDPSPLTLAGGQAATLTITAPPDVTINSSLIGGLVFRGAGPNVEGIRLLVLQGANPAIEGVRVPIVLKPEDGPTALVAERRMTVASRWPGGTKTISQDSNTIPAANCSEDWSREFVAAGSSDAITVKASCSADTIKFDVTEGLSGDHHETFSGSLTGAGDDVALEVLFTTHIGWAIAMLFVGTLLALFVYSWLSGARRLALVRRSLNQLNDGAERAQKDYQVRVPANDLTHLTITGVVAKLVEGLLKRVDDVDRRSGVWNFLTPGLTGDLDNIQEEARSVSDLVDQWPATKDKLQELRHSLDKDKVAWAVLDRAREWASELTRPPASGSRAINATDQKTIVRRANHLKGAIFVASAFGEAEKDWEDWYPAVVRKYGTDRGAYNDAKKARDDAKIELNGDDHIVDAAAADGAVKTFVRIFNDAKVYYKRRDSDAETAAAVFESAKDAIAKKFKSEFEKIPEGAARQQLLSEIEATAVETMEKRWKSLQDEMKQQHIDWNKPSGRSWIGRRWDSAGDWIAKVVGRVKIEFADRVVNFLVFAVAIWTGLQALYFDEPWGDLGDYFSAIAWAFTAGAVMKVIVEALGRPSARHFKL